MSFRAISLIKKLITRSFFILLIQYFGPNLQKTIIRNDDERWNDLIRQTSLVLPVKTLQGFHQQNVQDLTSDTSQTVIDTSIV